MTVESSKSLPGLLTSKTRGSPCWTRKGHIPKHQSPPNCVRVGLTAAPQSGPSFASKANVTDRWVSPRLSMAPYGLNQFTIVGGKPLLNMVTHLYCTCKLLPWWGHAIKSPRHTVCTIVFRIQDLQRREGTLFNGDQTSRLSSWTGTPSPCDL